MSQTEIEINKYIGEVSPDMIPIPVKQALLEIVQQLDSCNYETEAGYLKNNVAFLALKRLAQINGVRDIIREQDHLSRAKLEPLESIKQLIPYLEYRNKVATQFYNAAGVQQLAAEELKRAIFHSNFKIREILGL
jgi:hypothetical protein